jgi:hypothetical protein
MLIIKVGLGDVIRHKHSQRIFEVIDFQGEGNTFLCVTRPLVNDLPTDDIEKWSANQLGDNFEVMSRGPQVGDRIYPKGDPTNLFIMLIAETGDGMAKFPIPPENPEVVRDAANLPRLTLDEIRADYEIMPQGGSV